ncbi:penicillin acylase family protein [Parashewanella spongiae]|uniref:Penicillin acylase family protein n=1 Tax=Parashewanella spongiae TaxID=342950 RepID=A0A3A6T4J3_9GAMM|nr:penicillin acylase family protein [Parashewanella spongiae]MCL1080163.1 penicillin acylase family protein [Parashewanella spongiae]RJY02504.1 penicillin acylase family protein [Parashewanella spongiae]
MLYFKKILLSLFVLLISAVSIAYLILIFSLPTLQGQIQLPQIELPISISRDKSGVPTIIGASRADVAFATGFLHAQDRFFQMDLSRRNSAGELSEIFGSRALSYDKKQRKHRFRKIAMEAFSLLPSQDKQILSMYAKGVNEGLNALAVKPFEYWLLGVTPKAWKEEDSFLTIFSMYFDLNDSNGILDSTKGFILKTTTPEVLSFLSPQNTRWDSPLQHEPAYTKPTIPNKEQINLRERDSNFYTHLTGKLVPDGFIGSNNWAVSGNITSNHSAIVENDMHLGLRVPTTWYRAQLIYPQASATSTQKQNIKITGVTLPGLPNIVIGSNGHIAWGFTNSYGDWTDLIELEINNNQYLTNQGKTQIKTWYDTIEVKDEPSVEVSYQTTHWGPIITSPLCKCKFALTWTAHKPSATNLNLLKLETAHTVKQAIEIATTAGIPPQNFTVGDSKGNIGWTIAGRIPKRNLNDPSTPINWSKADTHWRQWLASEEYPRLINPSNNRIWTANARVVSGTNKMIIGDGGYALGARQQQIENKLLELNQATESKLLNIALDNEAIYLNNWRQLILSSLTTEKRIHHPEREVFYQYVNNWSAAASTEDIGYRLVREFYDNLNLEVLQSIGKYLLSKSSDKHLDVNDTWLQKVNHEEEMLLRLYQDQPMNWLSPKYDSWDQLFTSVVDNTINRLAVQYNTNPISAIKMATWGDKNRARIYHPLSEAIPYLGHHLNMSSVKLAGDSWMPNVQRPTAGVSERMIVSPGNEEYGIFHMPGGQSGHPLSEYYSMGYNDWATGSASAFLPQQAKYTLTLTPKK